MNEITKQNQDYEQYGSKINEIQNKIKNIENKMQQKRNNVKQNVKILKQILIKNNIDWNVLLTSSNPKEIKDILKKINTQIEFKK